MVEIRNGDTFFKKERVSAVVTAILNEKLVSKDEIANSAGLKLIWKRLNIHRNFTKSFSRKLKAIVGSIMEENNDGINVLEGSFDDDQKTPEASFENISTPDASFSSSGSSFEIKKVDENLKSSKFF